MGEMNERQSDFEWLQQFARAGSQSAFRDLVRRHLDLVYATALRKLEDPSSAQEVAQNVFTVLARKAWQFAPDDSLPAWLHKTALLESKSWLRGELRRRRREQTAAELGTTMKTSDEQPAFKALVPLLDEALLSLREKDRTALLLRFYESQSLRDVGAALGVSDDTAQKRVAGALEKLSQFFQRRGFKTATVALTATAIAHTVTSAPAGVAVSIAAIASAGTATAGKSLILLKLITMTKAKIFSVGALIVATTVVPLVVEHQKNSRLVAENAELKRLIAQVPTLKAEKDQLLSAKPDYSAAAALQQERLGHDSERMKLLKLRAQVAAARRADERLSSDQRRLAQQQAVRQLFQLPNVPPDQVRSVPLETRIELGSVANAGVATPESTLESYLSVVMQQDFESWLNLKFTPEYRAAFEEGMNYGSLQTNLSAEKASFGGVTALKLRTIEMHGENQAGVNFNFEYDHEPGQDEATGGTMMMNKVGEEWKVIAVGKMYVGKSRPRKSPNP